MNVFVSHISALQFWDARWQASVLPTTRAVPKATPPQLSPQIKHELQYSGVSLPIHTVVPTQTARSQSASVRSHLWAASQHRGLYVDAGGFYVSTPEAIFFQLASELSMPELVMLGLRMCSGYILDPDEHCGFRKHEPLTSVAELRKLAPRMRGTRGFDKARRALRYIADGSASPRESEVAALLCLPVSAGGYGLPTPQFNYEITVDLPDATMRQHHEHRKCDLFWPAARLGLEYDSKQFHSEGWQKDSDAARRTSLELCGITIISARSEQVSDVWKFDELAQLVAKRLGRRLRSTRSDLAARRLNLRDTLRNQKIR